jgi:hypothetical protein
MSAAGGNQSVADLRQSSWTGKVAERRSGLVRCVSSLFIPRDWQTDNDEQPDQDQNQGRKP